MIMLSYTTFDYEVEGCNFLLLYSDLLFFSSVSPLLKKKPRSRCPNIQDYSFTVCSVLVLCSQERQTMCMNHRSKEFVCLLHDELVIGSSTESCGGNDNPVLQRSVPCPERLETYPR
jgi:hypothetical protein